MKKKSEYEGFEDILFFDDEPEYIEMDLIYIKVAYGLFKQNEPTLRYMNKEIMQYEELIQMIDSCTLNLIKTAENTDVINWGMVLDSFVKEYNKIKDFIKEATYIIIIMLLLFKLIMILQYAFKSLKISLLSYLIACYFLF